MEYEQKLREEDLHTEKEIQWKLDQIKDLSGKSSNAVEGSETYKMLDQNGLVALRHQSEGMKGRKGLIKAITRKLNKLEEEEKTNKHRKELKLDENQLDMYDCVLTYIEMKKELITHLGEGPAGSFLEKYHIDTVYEVANLALKSKQCNEPYEIQLSSGLRLKNIDHKHGFDAVDEATGEYYEHKPSSDTNNPGGTINDDSIDKIEKCENLEKEGYLILGGIDKEKYTFNIIYKFPLSIYNQDRREYFNSLKQNNANKDKQTRSTYSINVKKSIKLCNLFDLDYYVWER
jgi:hypothetical protein